MRELLKKVSGYPRLLPDVLRLRNMRMDRTRYWGTVGVLLAGMVPVQVFSGSGSAPLSFRFLLAAGCWLLLLAYLLNNYQRLRSFAGYILLPLLLTWATAVNFSDTSGEFIRGHFPLLFWPAMFCLGIDICLKLVLGTLHRRTRVLTAVVSAAVQAAALLLPVAVLLRCLVEHAPVIPEDIEAVWQTHFREALDFIMASPFCLLGLAFFLLFFVLKLWWNLAAPALGNPLASGKKRLTVVLSCCILCAGMGWALGGSSRQILFYKLLSDSYDYFRELREFNARAIRRRTLLVPAAAGMSRHRGGPGRLVLILGESQNRNFMSAYGYGKDTTPWFHSLRGDGRFHVFDRAYSCHVLTVLVAKLLFTEMNQYDRRDCRFGSAGTVFDMLRRCGFRTRWISNQHECGTHNSPVAALAATADEAVYCNSLQDAVYGDRAGLDDILLPFAQSLPADDRSFTVFHLQGCHFPYRKRYPEGFLADGGWTEYEKAVAYNDTVLKRLVESLRQQQADVIVFLSDHGEVPADGLYHQPSKFRPAMAEIPMFVYLSERYEKQNPALARQLYRARGRVFTNDLAYNLLLGLARIGQAGAPDRYDVLQDGYALTGDNSRTLYGKQAVGTR